MYNWNKYGRISICFCVGLIFCISALTGCKDKEKEEAIKRAETAEAALQETKTQVQAAQNERDSLKTTVDSLSAQLKDFGQLKEQVTAITNERDAALAKIKEQTDAIIKVKDDAAAQVKNQIAAITNERDDALEEVTKAQTMVENLKSQLQETLQKIATLEQANKELQAMLDELRKKVGDEIKIPPIPAL
jgi:chromosome segregation ATPase